MAQQNNGQLGDWVTKCANAMAKRVRPFCISSTVDEQRQVATCPCRLGYAIMWTSQLGGEI